MFGKTPIRLMACLLLFVPAAAASADDDAAAEWTVGEVEVCKHLSADEFELTTIHLWPGAAPDEPRPLPEELVADIERGRQIRNVTRPSITVARPKGLNEPLPALIVCPGGGYGGVGVDVGGVDVINWAKSQGMAGVYLKYRVPKRHRGFAQHHHALQDIQRAVSLLRSRASELRIDPGRIGAIGFSAGGHLVALLSTNHGPTARTYEPIDLADAVSCKLDFAAMVAPAYLTNPILSDQLDPALHAENIARNVTPPTFITSAVTDKFTIGATHYLLALREQRVPVEAHIYEAGGHAEGIHDGPDNQWPAMLADWLCRRGVIETATGKN